MLVTPEQHGCNWVLQEADSGMKLVPGIDCNRDQERKWQPTPVFLPGESQAKSSLVNWKDPLEKEMATHSNILAWEIPWTEEPGRLQSMG